MARAELLTSDGVHGGLREAPPRRQPMAGDDWHHSVPDLLMISQWHVAAADEAEQPAGQQAIPGVVIVMLLLLVRVLVLLLFQALKSE